MGAGNWESHHAITKLMFRYAECVDTANFDGLSELFARGVLTSTSAADPEGGMTGEQVGRFYAATNRVHEDGTLRTRHLATNVIVDIDEEADTATARSYYVVFQATGKPRRRLRAYRRPLAFCPTGHPRRSDRRHVGTPDVQPDRGKGPV